MTIQDTTAKVREDGNGVKSVFSFPFRIFTEGDIEISTIVKSTGVATLKVLNTDYTVSINPITEGGTITYLTTVPSALEEFFGLRIIADTQPTDIPNVGSIRESQIETPLDRRTMVSQQQQEEIDRSLKFVETSPSNTPFLPEPDTGKGIFWNAQGDFENTTTDLNDIVSAAAASAAAAAARAAAALTSETNAATSETNASTSETNASASATAAAASAAAALVSELAAALSAAQLTGTSTTSVTIGLGVKVFTTQANKFFDAGNFLLIVSDANPSTDFMIGQVTTYVGTTLTMNIQKIGGSGTLTDWTIRLSGSPGLDGVGSTFLSLADTPGSYAGQALQIVRVNAGATALEFSAPAGGSESTVVLDVNQTTHGFSVGDVLKVTGVNTYALAQADSEANAEVAGIVSAVAGANDFTIQFSGQITGLSGLTAGQVSFLSPSVAGALTTTEPTADGEVSKHLLIADSVTTGILLNFLGSLIESGASSSGGGIPNGFAKLSAVRASVIAATITADKVVVSDGTTDIGLATVSETADITVSGVDGLDTGSEAASTWYYLYIIFNPSTSDVAALLSVSPTSPTLPAGYTHRALLSAVFNDSSSDFIDFTQNNTFYGYTSWRNAASGFGAGANAVDVTDFVANGISNVGFGVIGGDGAGAAISNINTLSPDFPSAPHLNAYGKNQSSTALALYWKLDILTADTLYVHGGDSNGRMHVHGFEVNKL